MIVTNHFVINTFSQWWNNNTNETIFKLINHYTIITYFCMFVGTFEYTMVQCNNLMGIGWEREK